MTVALRAHHLLCMLTYVGKGYDAEFVAGYDGIAGRIAAGESIRVVEGPDDICAPLLGGPQPHCIRAGVTERDALATRDLSRILGQDLAPGSLLGLSADRLADLRAAFRLGVVREACTRCEWHSLCTSIADEDFAGARIRIG